MIVKAFVLKSPGHKAEACQGVRYCLQDGYLEGLARQRRAAADPSHG